MSPRAAFAAEAVRILAICTAFFWAIIGHDYSRACFWLLCAHAIEVKPPRGAA